MKEINRQAAFVRAKQPFVDWINEVERSMGSSDRSDLERVNDDSHVYLFREFDMLEDTDEYFPAFKEDIFVNELAAWFTDPALWPSRRTIDVFDDWFEVTYHSMLLDLESGRVKKAGQWL
jgi:hypothetical protein